MFSGGRESPLQTTISLLSPGYRLQDGETPELYPQINRTGREFLLYLIETFIKIFPQVGYWLEQLHDKRVEATGTLDKIKEKLNRKLKSLDIAVMIDQYSNIAQDIRKRIEKVDTVEEDIESCQEQLSTMLLHEIISYPQL